MNEQESPPARDRQGIRTATHASNGCPPNLEVATTRTLLPARRLPIEAVRVPCLFDPPALEKHDSIAIFKYIRSMGGNNNRLFPM